MIPLLKANYLFLVPLVVLSLPPSSLFQLQILVVAVLSLLGLGGMITRNRTAISLVSVTLLGLIVWGKIASDLYRLTSIDSALLLLEFLIVIFLMEASNTTITFDRTYEKLLNRSDEISLESRSRLVVWARNQLVSLARTIAAAFVLSLSLVVVGDLFGVSVNQLAVSGTLVLAAVVALLVLLTYGREPDERKRMASLVPA